MKKRSAFERARRVEDAYARDLRKIAKHVDDIIRAFIKPGDDTISPAALAQIDKTLRKYSGTLMGWAEAVSDRMVKEAEARNRRAWMDVARKIGKGIAREIATTPVGEAYRASMAQQVALITSLPTEAADRVHKLAIEGMSTGRRASEIAKEILETGDVTRSRATMIARTETGRASTELSKARAASLGSTHFVWRTSEDYDVRKTHAALNGKVFRWDNPPECDPGHRALPGCIWNCRCWAEPVFNEDAS